MQNGVILKVRKQAEDVCSTCCQTTSATSLRLYVSMSLCLYLSIYLSLIISLSIYQSESGHMIKLLDFITPAMRSMRGKCLTL